ncbi:MAG: hypothetical protein KZQ99_20405 [Candidatus Thiodiazotropha sp. (ex Dulcina madagascariensis)]|nr:hypothetical protein [Candidatus Thiodiazotropha sp. (ex Dulcina madagascariensis)]MCU7937202.1 hypothetical protein [Candidatus Thiodiazotropha sp. (ex Dulcina madagascariensis)]
MNKLLILIIIGAGLYYYITWNPSTESIVNEMEFGDKMIHKDRTYYSDWSKEIESISGYVRRKDRHYDENFPIITYDLALTTGDYNDPNIVEVRHQGGGNYLWLSKTKPTGTITFYHTVPSSIASQSKLDAINEGDTIEILAKVSKNNEIKNDTGAFVRLMHSNHKMILVSDVK